jgi:hypothetical protein
MEDAHVGKALLQQARELPQQKQQDAMQYQCRLAVCITISSIGLGPRNWAPRSPLWPLRGVLLVWEDAEAIAKRFPGNGCKLRGDKGQERLARTGPCCKLSKWTISMHPGAYDQAGRWADAISCSTRCSVSSASVNCGLTRSADQRSFAAAWRCGRRPGAP